MRQPYSWKLPRTSIELGARTAVMGVLNVTPDSFSDGGLYLTRDRAINHAREMEQQGADIIDIGGESTRPGNQAVLEEEEVRRVLPVVEALVPILKIPISVDTYRSAVAGRAIEAGAQIVNDISGFRFDPKLPAVVHATRAAVVLMHSRGDRDSIHKQPPTDDPVHTAIEGLRSSLAAARHAGIDDEAVAIDPGIGFSKDASASVEILKSLRVFSKLPYPLLVGTSRKSFIRAIIQDSPESRLMGTAATVVLAISGGAHMVRVHDVRAMRLAADVADRILQE
jgi:dihydropteroate synthase